MLCIMLQLSFLAISMQYTVYALNSEVVLHSKRSQWKQTIVESKCNPNAVTAYCKETDCKSQ